MSPYAASTPTEKTGPTVNNLNRLFDSARDILGVETDLALSQVLGVPAPIISKLRHGERPVGASLLIRLHDATGMEIREMKALLEQAPEANSAGMDSPPAQLLEPWSRATSRPYIESPESQIYGGARLLDSKR